MPPRLPPPEYVSEVVEGAVYALPSGESALVVGAPPHALAESAPVIAGALTLRYGIPFHAPSADVIVPGLFVSERGQAVAGRAAWDLMTQKYQLYPRADVVGVRLNGREANVFMRDLDWGAPVRVLAYRGPEDMLPAAQPQYGYVGSGGGALPALAARYLVLVSDDHFVAPPENQSNQPE
jgi:hypothetical protein